MARLSVPRGEAAVAVGRIYLTSGLAAPHSENKRVPKLLQFVAPPNAHPRNSPAPTCHRRPCSSEGPWLAKVRF